MAGHYFHSEAYSYGPVQINSYIHIRCSARGFVSAMCEGKRRGTWPIAQVNELIIIGKGTI